MKYENFEDLKRDCLNCKNCALAATRTNVVVGVGNENADIMFVGEGPGENEDLQGEPFVGKAGQLLDKYLEVIWLSRKKNISFLNKFTVLACHLKIFRNKFLCGNSAKAHNNLGFYKPCLAT